MHVCACPPVVAAKAAHLPRKPEALMPGAVRTSPPGTPKRRLVTPLRAVVAALLLAVTVAAIVFKTRGPAVDVVEAQRRSVEDRVVATGRVLPLARIHVGSVVLARVNAVHVDEGDTVEQGAVLVTLDDAEQRAAVAQAKAALRQAEAKLAQVGGVVARVALESVRRANLRKEQASTDLERERALLAAGASTPERVEEAEKAYEVAVSDHASASAEATSAGPGGVDRRAAAAAVIQAQASLQAAKARLAQTEILAPTDCLVLVRSVEPGDVVQPGAALMVLARTGWTGLAVQVDEKNLSLLDVGQKAWASADAFPTERFEAQVQSLAPLIDVTKGTIEVKLRVPEPPAYLRPDMTVSVSIDGGKRDGVVLVPGSSIRDAATPTPYLFLLRDGRVERREVRLGVRVGERIEIASGLETGDRVVVDGSGLAPGQRVRARELSLDEASRAL